MENTRKVEHVLLYGTLTHDSPRQVELGVGTMLELVGDSYVTGSMYELSTYPGVVAEGDNIYAAQAYRFTHPSVLSVLDAFQEYDPVDGLQSVFTRRRVAAPGLGIDAWAYYLSPEALPDGSPLITDASWAEYILLNGKFMPDEVPESFYMATS